jgi:hypothetical protein
MPIHRVIYGETKYYLPVFSNYPLQNAAILTVMKAFDAG